MYQEGTLLMQQEGKGLGNLSPGGPKDTHFQSSFGAGATTIRVAWHAMDEHDLIPNNLVCVHYSGLSCSCVSTQITTRVFVLFLGELASRPFKIKYGTLFLLCIS